MFTSAFVDYPACFVAGIRGTLLVRAHTPLREVLPQFGQYLICVLPMCARQPNRTLALTHFCYLVDVQVMPPLPPCTHLPWPCGQKPDPQEVFAHPPPQVGVNSSHRSERLLDVRSGRFIIRHQVRILQHWVLKGTLVMPHLLTQCLKRAAFRAHGVFSAGPGFALFVVVDFMDSVMAILQYHSIVPRTQGYRS